MHYLNRGAAIENFLHSAYAKRAINIFREAHPSPAFSVALVKDGTIIDSILKRMDNHTCSRIASMSKSFAAASIIMLRDEGKLSLSSHLKDVLDVTAIHPLWHQITIHQLLSMTTPIVTDNDWADRYLGNTNDEYSDFFKREPVFAPTNDNPILSYSNLAYMLIGRIISAVSGIDARTFISEQILEPLNMTDTGWDNPTRLDANYLRGYRKIGNGWGEEASFQVKGDGAVFGGLWSSISDLAIWIDYLSSPKNALLSEFHAPISAETFTPLATDMTERQYLSYGYGLRTALVGGKRFSGHSGALPGYGSAMRWDTKTRLGVVAIANSTYCPVWNLARDLLAAVEYAEASADQNFPNVSQVGQQLHSLIRGWPHGKENALFAPNVYPDLTFEKIDEEFCACARTGMDGEFRPLTFETGEITFCDGDSLRTIVFTIAPVKPLAIQKLEFTRALKEQKP